MSGDLTIGPVRSRIVEIVDLGRLDYAAALARQEAAVEEVRRGGTSRLLMVEHPHVYTIGRGGDADNLHEAPDRLGVPLYRVGRGGDATYHGPGQIVGYPVVALTGRERDVRLHLRRIEDVLVRTLRAFGLPALRVEGRTGAWIEGDPPRKIASIGVGIRRWITWHGFALNVDPDLAYFDAIRPCALDGVRMTSMASELGETVTIDEVRARLVSEFADVFRVQLIGRVAGATGRRGRAWAGRLSRSQPGVSERRKPSWLRARMPGGEAWQRTRRVLSDLGLHTVCQEAFCPNAGECWAHSTATFMLMGDTCTRSCGFCAVKHGLPARLDLHEPERVAEAAERLGLRHVVVTSVNRDDLSDGGAAHFAATARAIKERLRGCAVELLIPDFQGDADALRIVVEAPVDVLNHNTETVPRLYPRVRPGARFERSVELLRRAKAIRPELLTKSGLMVGLGETEEDLVGAFRRLRDAHCDILTLGQYLRPTREHLPVARWVTPEEFSHYRRLALGLGFRHVESGPLVRSSYHAWEHVPA